MTVNLDALISFEDLSPILIPIVVGQDRFLLTEATSDAVMKYRTAMTRGATVKDGVYSLGGGMAEAEMVLVSCCLFEAEVDGASWSIKKDKQGRALLASLNLVKSWPYRITSQLFDKVKEISPALNPAESREQLEKQLEKIKDKLASLGEGETEVEENIPN